MFEDPAPLPVNAAVTLVADDQIEISRRIITIDIDHALQRGDGDLFFVLETPAGAQHIARIIRQMLGKRVFRLLGERDSVHEEQYAGNGVRLKQPLDKAAAVRVLPVPVAISTRSLRRPCPISWHKVSMHSI